MNKKISKYYDQKQASEYEARRNNLVWHAESEVFDKIKNRIASKYDNSMEVLDVGAGTGRWIPHLHKVSSKYVGTDISENMLNQAKLKLEICPEEFKDKVKLIVSSVNKMSQNVSGKYDLIIMTRFLSHFSINEIRNILNIVKNFSKGDLIVSVRVADKSINLLSEILDLILRSPIGAIKRFRKSGRLTYARLDTDYNAVIAQSGFRVTKKNLVTQDKYNRYEYWELTLD